MTRAKQIKGAERPTMAQAEKMLRDMGWEPSAGSWESDHVVFCFSKESCPGTYGGAAAVVTWNSIDNWLCLPESKPKGVRFV